MDPAQRRLLTAAAIIGTAWIGAATASYLLMLDGALHASAAGGTSIQILGIAVPDSIAARFIERFGSSPDGAWKALIGSTTYSRLLLAVGFGWLGFAAIVLRKQTLRAVRRHATAAAHPVDLAVVRIVVFGFAAVMVGREYIIMFASLPHELLVPPTGSGWLLDLVPVSSSGAAHAHAAFVVACLAAAAGWRTRVTATIATILGVYVLGIPNFFGKVDHYNHVIWLMALLAASPCADALSVDALTRAWRSGARAKGPSPSARYGLPLRFMWLLIGICYFFPGFWKLYHGGLAWPLGDTLQSILYRKWASMPDFVPLVPLSEYPLLYRTAASGTILFELAFVFLVFVPMLRPWAVATGLMFHNATGLLMSIWFLHLQVAYVAFVPWQRFLHALGRRLFPRQVRLSYDPNDHFAARATALVRELDVLGRVRYGTHAFSADRGDSAPLRVDDQPVGARLTATSMALVARVPGIVLVLPFLLVESAYQDRRKMPANGTSTTPLRSARRSASTGDRTHGSRATWAVGMLLVAGSIGFGGLGIERGWPFASYPTFATIDAPVMDILHATRIDGLGRSSDVDLDPVAQHFVPAKFEPLVRGIVRTADPVLRRSKLETLHAVIVDVHPELTPSDWVVLHLDTESVDPIHAGNPPLQRVVLGGFGTPLHTH